jgi:hypothetical protein
MPNKRLIPRQRRRLRLTIGERGAFTVDVSPGGFCVELPAAIKPGTQISGKLAVDEREFPFTGEVRWARAGEPRLGIRARIGVRFTGIDNAFYGLFLDPERAAG